MTSLNRKIFFALLLACGLLLSCVPAEAVVVRYETNLGDIDVRLFHTATPLSVANFLNYVDDGDYDGSFFHRAPLVYRLDDLGQTVLDNQGQPIVDMFVLQGGGFKYSDADGLSSIPTDPPVVNEPVLSNEFGTLAYAKLGGDPNSATGGFFFNTTNNISRLDNQNGGFTVFGRVVTDFTALNAIAALSPFDLDPPADPTPENPNPYNPPTFDDVPILGTTGTLEEILVIISSVTVLDVPDGDYNFDGVVDAADYTVWRSTNGSTTQVEADGNGDGVVDALDLQVWEDAYGGTAASLTAGGSAAPEPLAATLALAAGAAALAWRRR